MTLAIVVYCRVAVVKQSERIKNTNSWRIIIITSSLVRVPLRVRVQRGHTVTWRALQEQVQGVRVPVVVVGRQEGRVVVVSEIRQLAMNHRKTCNTKNLLKTDMLGTDNPMCVSVQKF